MFGKKVLILAISLTLCMVSTFIDADVLFEDNFDLLDIGNWTIVNGDWHVTTGEVTSRAEERDILILEKDFRDYTLETTFVLSDILELTYGATAGILFDYTDENTYGFLGWGPYYDGLLYLHIGDDLIPISNNWDLGYGAEDTVKLKLQRFNDNIRVYVADKLVCDYMMSGMVFPRGKIGLQLFGIHAYFDYIKITNEFYTDPAVYVTLDRNEYLSDSSIIEVFISGVNPGRDYDVDLYFAVLDPTQNLYLFPDWNSNISPLSFTIPENFYLTPTKVFSFELPNDSPPISRPGNYVMATVLAKRGTMNFTQDLSTVDFKVIISCPEGMVEIPPGEYMDRFGEFKETDRYCIDVYEYPNVSGEMPTQGDSWYFANTKCIEAGKHLCTEAQWTKACKGPNNYRYTYGNDFDETRCRSQLEFGDGPAASGSYLECKNEYGVYDMSGNLWEFTSEVLPTNKKVLRGGAWHTWGDVFCDHYFDKYNADHNDKEVGGSEGFRCCK